MKIYLDKSPLTDMNKLRGVGVYTKNLYEALRIKGVDFVETISRADIIHFPYFNPFFVTLPIFNRKKTVVTVHDLIPIKFSQRFPRGIKGEIKWQIQKWKLRKIEAIITDSECSKRDIVEFTKIDPQKIHVIYLAPNKEFQKYNAEKQNYLLYVGDVNWNKNIPGLIMAFNNLIKKSVNLQLKLVTQGLLNDCLETREIQRLIERLGIKDRIQIINNLDIAGLVKLYNEALVYIQPSFYEGFGLPVLEAMACGCPVISSNQGSLPEIYGEAALTFNPYTEGELEKVVLKLIEDEKMRNELIKKGKIQVDKFSWDKTAKETIDVYKSILNF